MLVDIVGMRKLDFENDEGNQVCGTQVFGFKDNAHGDVSSHIPKDRKMRIRYFP